MKSRYKKFTLCTKLHFYLKCLENTRLQQLLTSCCIMYNLLTSSLCTISFGMKSRYKKFTLCTKLYFYLKCLENTQLQQLLTSCCIIYNLLTSSLCTISFGMKSRYKKFALCTKLYFYLKCLENTRLQQLLTSCCIIYNLLWKEKLAQNFTLCPKLYFPYHHLYTIIQISKCQHHCYHCQCLHFKLRFLWSWCLPQFLHKKFTLCTKLYFPYHHLYTNIQNVNIIAIIASDFTSNFGFCGLGAYHSFCTKNSHCARNFTFHIIICTQLSISSFVHKYPKCQHHCYHCQ